ncbi:hypothetical protein NEOKW01_0371 [Nematocida sp. AWRm80]|nr:hypothetical protein NEOKW01_0371 [Nematocida sp. AWRm80]
MHISNRYQSLGKGIILLLLLYGALYLEDVSCSSKDKRDTKKKSKETDCSEEFIPVLPMNGTSQEHQLENDAFNESPVNLRKNKSRKSLKARLSGFLESKFNKTDTEECASRSSNESNGRKMSRRRSSNDYNGVEKDGNDLNRYIEMLNAMPQIEIPDKRMPEKIQEDYFLPIFIQNLMLEKVVEITIQWEEFLKLLTNQELDQISNRADIHFQAIAEHLVFIAEQAHVFDQECLYIKRGLDGSLLSSKVMNLSCRQRILTTSISIENHIMSIKKVIMDIALRKVEIEIEGYIRIKQLTPTALTASVSNLSCASLDLAMNHVELTEVITIIFNLISNLVDDWKKPAYLFTNSFEDLYLLSVNTGLCKEIYKSALETIQKLTSPYPRKLKVKSKCISDDVDTMRPQSFEPFSLAIKAINKLSAIEALESTLAAYYQVDYWKRSYMQILDELVGLLKDNNSESSKNLVNQIIKLYNLPFYGNAPASAYAEGIDNTTNSYYLKIIECINALDYSILLTDSSMSNNITSYTRERLKYINIILAKVKVSKATQNIDTIILDLIRDSYYDGLKDFIPQKYYKYAYYNESQVSPVDTLCSQLRNACIGIETILVKDTINNIVMFQEFCDAAILKYEEKEFQQSPSNTYESSRSSNYMPIKYVSSHVLNQEIASVVSSKIEHNTMNIFARNHARSITSLISSLKSIKSLAHPETSADKDVRMPYTLYKYLEKPIIPHYKLIVLSSNAEMVKHVLEYGRELVLSEIWSILMKKKKLIKDKILSSNYVIGSTPIPVECLYKSVYQYASFVDHLDFGSNYSFSSNESLQITPDMDHQYPNATPLNTTYTNGSANSVYIRDGESYSDGITDNQ